MGFPTPEDIEKKKIEKLGPAISDLEDLCVNSMLQEGVPVKVPLRDFPSIARQQVLYNAQGSGWKVRLDHDVKLGDVLIIDEMPPAVPPKKFIEKLKDLIGG